MSTNRKYLILKRLIDIVFSVTGIIVLSPLMLLITLAIKISSSGSILFKQERVGKNKKIFEIWKFRTMKTETPEVPTGMLDNPEKYITKVGKFLRKTSLDEIPQLFNICKGDMSFIGPRPVLENEIELIKQRDRYGVYKYKPGLTGLAQINGRDELEADVKAKYDGEYVKNIGIKIDTFCFLKTVKIVLKQDGIVEGNVSKQNYDRNNKTDVMAS